MLPEQPVERDTQVDGRLGRAFARELLRALLDDRAGERVARHVHVRVGLAGERVGALVVPRCVRVDLALELVDVLADRHPDRVPGKPGRPGEEGAERLDVALQAADGLPLCGLVVLGQADRVVDEEADVSTPLQVPVQKLPASPVAVDRADRVRELDAVPVERAGDRLEVPVTVEALLRREHRQERMLPEQPVERHAKLGRGTADRGSGRLARVGVVHSSRRRGRSRRRRACVGVALATAPRKADRHHGENGEEY
jgi:hypothetical protein